jgi:hypothetical protein
MAEVLAAMIVMGMVLVTIMIALVAAAAAIIPFVGKMIRPLLALLWLRQEANAFRTDPAGHAKSHLDRKIQAEAARRRSRKRTPRRRRFAWSR